MAREGEEQANTEENNSGLYDLLFRGETAPDKHIDQVKARVAEDFKLDEAAVNQLFSGAVVSLKRNIDRATAERIFQRLSDAGAMAKIVPAQHQPKSSDQSVSNNQSGDKSFTLAPLGSDVLENAVVEEQSQQSISLDHLGLEPVGSNIIEERERETIEPKVVDTSHLTLE